MKKFFVFRYLTTKEKEHLIRTAENEPVRIYYHDEGNVDFLPVSIEKIDLRKEFNIPSTYVRDKIYELETTEFNGKKFIDWLVINDSSIWFYLKDKVTKVADSFIRITGSLEKYSEKQNGINTGPVIFYLNPDPLLEKYVTNKFPGSTLIKGSTSPRGKGPAVWIRLAALLFNNISRFLWGGAMFLNRLFRPNNYLIYHDERLIQEITFANGLRKGRGNPRINNIIDEAKKEKDFVVLNELVPSRMTNSFKTIREKKLLKPYAFKRSLQFEFFQGLVLLAAFPLIKAYSRQKSFTTCVKDLKESNSGYNREIREYLLNIIRNNAFRVREISLRWDSADLLFSLMRPKVIFGVDELSQPLKSIMDRAHHSGVKTVGYQHGIMNITNPNYFQQKALKGYGKNVLPDYFLTWGKHWSRMLVEHSVYEEENLVEVGNQNSDLIYKLKGNNNSERKNIIFFTQPFPKRQEEFYRAMLKDFLLISNKYKKYKFFLKPHPRENIDNLKKLLEKISVTHNVEIDLQTSTFELLNEAKVSITCFSSVGMEAILFDSILLVFDYNHEDLGEYIGRKLGAPVYSLKDLDNYLDAIEKGKFPIESESILKSMGSIYFKPNGEVSIRIIETLKNSSFSN